MELQTTVWLRWLTSIAMRSHNGGEEDEVLQHWQAARGCVRVPGTNGLGTHCPVPGLPGLQQSYTPVSWPGIIKCPIEGEEGLNELRCHESTEARIMLTSCQQGICQRQDAAAPPEFHGSQPRQVSLVSAREPERPPDLQHLDNCRMHPESFEASALRWDQQLLGVHLNDSTRCSRVMACSTCWAMRRSSSIMASWKMPARGALDSARAMSCLASSSSTTSILDTVTAQPCASILAMVSCWWPLRRPLQQQTVLRKPKSAGNAGLWSLSRPGAAWHILS